jgi:hypothetical protein
MKNLVIILAIVAAVGIVLSIFPNLGGLSFGVRTGIGNRQNFNNSFNQQPNPQQAPDTLRFGLASVLNFVRIGLWVIVLIIAILLIAMPKKTKR